MSAKKLALVFFVGSAFVLYTYQTLSSLWMLVGMPYSHYSLVALWKVFANAYIAGFTIGFSSLIGLFLMVTGGLIHGREARG